MKSPGLEDKGREEQEVRKTLNQSAKFVNADSQWGYLYWEGILS